MKKEIQKLIQQAIQSAFGVDFDMKKIKVDYPPEGMGDFSTNAPLLLAKEVGKSPMEVAEELKTACSGPTARPQRDADGPLQFEKIEVAKPGFLNLYLAEKSLEEAVTDINREKNNFGSSEIGGGKKIHLDFVSANPTGPIHVGNARGGPLGDTLANVFQKSGYAPYREYYVNDAGNQVEILGHSILGDSEAQYNDEYIEEIRKKLGFDNNKSPALAVREIGEKVVKIILDEIIKPSMEKFRIKFDNYFSEKELQASGKVDEAIEMLKEKNLIYQKEGAIWFKSTEFGDDKDRVVIKSTGEKTYFGSDIAYHKEKIERGFDRLIDIWGADHHGEVARTKGALEALGHKDKLDVILTQFVRVLKDDQEMKMSKRAGTYVSVDDLIDEVGCDATRFFFLMHSADSHMNFDMDLAKERSEKNPVYYVQYAHARITSILQKAEELVSTSDVGNVPTSDVELHPKERALIFELLKFPDLVEEISKNYAVHHLPQYAIGLADKFHSFYNGCRVIDEANLELTAARLELVKAVQIVLAEVLRLMGISAPESM
ncbi:MAG TPA: arginine--tRNA ligase [Candidatus Bathyarchaeia archaeon]|nr:arginine--tRNA ligase [Candidatus Bathyarchaeia archaeon]